MHFFLVPLDITHRCGSITTFITFRVNISFRAAFTIESLSFLASWWQDYFKSEIRTHYISSITLRLVSAERIKIRSIKLLINLLLLQPANCVTCVPQYWTAKLIFWRISILPDCTTVLQYYISTNLTVAPQCSSY